MAKDPFPIKAWPMAAKPDGALAQVSIYNRAVGFVIL
jgi:hypothetical protein